MTTLFRIYCGNKPIERIALLVYGPGFRLAILAKTRRLLNVGGMVGQRRRRWTNIYQTLDNALYLVGCIQVPR